MSIKIDYMEDAGVNVAAWMKNLANLSPEKLMSLNWGKQVPPVAYRIIELINYIEKQQKEIDAEKEKNGEIIPIVEELKATKNQLINEKGLLAKIKRRKIETGIINYAETMKQIEGRINSLNESIHQCQNEIKKLEQENDPDLSAYILSVIKNYRFISRMP